MIKVTYILPKYYFYDKLPQKLKKQEFHQNAENDDGFVLFIYYCHDICANES